MAAFGVSSEDDAPENWNQEFAKKLTDELKVSAVKLEFQEMFIVEQQHTEAMFFYIIDAMLSSMPEDARDHAKKEFAEYAFLDRLTRAYDLIYQKRNRSSGLYVPDSVKLSPDAPG